MHPDTPPVCALMSPWACERPEKGTFSFSAKQPSAPQGGEKVNVPFSGRAVGAPDGPNGETGGVSAMHPEGRGRLEGRLATTTWGHTRA